MRMKYKDDPNLIENEIAKLSDTERKAFDFGYAVALCGFLEHIQDSKNRILSKLVISKDSSAVQIELLSRVYILDIYEKHYEKRLKKLQRDLQPSLKSL